MGQDRHDSIDGEAFGSQSVTFSDRLLETMTVRLRRGLPCHGVPPSLACASIQGPCDLAHILWSPERGTFLRISEACHGEGARRGTLQHGVLRCSPQRGAAASVLLEGDAEDQGHRV
jgi:hypothetical protein